MLCLCTIKKPEALKSLYRSPGNKKKKLVLCKNYVLRHLGITINIKNTKFVKDLPMIDAQFRFNQCNSVLLKPVQWFHMRLLKRVMLTTSLRKYVTWTYGSW